MTRSCRWEQCAACLGGFILAFSESLRAEAQFASCNVTLKSWMDLSEFPGDPYRANSCWGYVSPSGQEYALLGMSNQIAVVRITDPANPVLVGSVSHTSSNWADVRAYGTYAYACNEDGGGLDVIDLSDVDSNGVTLVQRVTTNGFATSNGLATSHTLDVNPVSGHLYLAGSNIDGGRLLAMSLADPANPTFVGQWSSAQGGRYVHEAHVVSYTSGPLAGKELAFCHNTGNGIRVADVTDKANIVSFSPSVEYPGLRYCHQGWTDPTRTYWYVNDELDDAVPPTPRTLIFNISDPADPLFVGTFSASAMATDHNLYWHNGFIFESNYKSGLRVFDAANPTAPVEVGWFDTYPDSEGFGLQGAWNHHPVFPSGTVIVSDINRGLFILDVSEALTGNLVFAYPNGQPELADPAGGTTVRVNVSGLGAALPQPDTGALHYDEGGGYQSVPMISVSPNVYDAVFPSSVCGSRISYYFSVETTNGATKTGPCGAPAQGYSTLSGSGFGPAFFADDAETGLAWTPGPNTATSGAWIRGDPVGTGFQPEDDHTPGAGVNCWHTGSNAVGDPTNHDVDGGTVRISSPTFNLVAGDAVVSYWRWYSERDGADDPGDGFLAEISNNNGLSWVTIESLSPYGGGWEKVQFLVSEFVPPTSQMKLRFSATDAIHEDDSGDIVEAAVDDVSVAPLNCSPIGAATVTSAVSRKPNPSGAGGICDINLLAGRTSEPWSGGITEVRIGFDLPPGAPGGSGITLEEATCAAPVFVPYSGTSVVSSGAAGNELAVLISPPLECGRTYRFSIGSSVTTIGGQSVEVRGLTGDVDGDGFTNATDRSLVISAWTKPAGFSCSTDLDQSGQTNSTDRSLVISTWTSGANCAP